MTTFNVSWTRAIAALLEMELIVEPVPLLLVTGGPSFIAAHPGTLPGLDAHLAFLPEGRRLEWLVCCHGASCLELAAAAVERGGHVSIGLGDHPYRELGEPSNADLVREVVAMARRCGREIATVDQAGVMLGRQRSPTVTGAGAR